MSDDLLTRHAATVFRAIDAKKAMVEKIAGLVAMNEKMAEELDRMEAKLNDAMDKLAAQEAALAGEFPLDAGGSTGGVV